MEGVALRTEIVAVAACCLAIGPATALACPGLSSERGLLHAAAPVLSPDQIAAEVRIVRVEGNAIETEVLRMIQACYAGSKLIIRPSYVTNCDRFEGAGARGVIVGVETAGSDGVLEIDPIRAPHRDVPTSIEAVERAAQAEVQAASWVRIEAGNAFSFEAPADIKAIPVQGIDSFVGRYASASFDLSFDYGAYPNNLSGYRKDPRFTVEEGMIDGRKSRIVTGPGLDCPRKSAAYVMVRDTPPMPTALQIGGCASSDAGVAGLHRLFRSLRFAKGVP